MSATAVSVLVLTRRSCDQAQRTAFDAHREYEDVSRVLRTELARHSKSRLDEIRIALQAQVDSVANLQKEASSHEQC